MASSPRQSTAVKRPKPVAFEASQQSGGFCTSDKGSKDNHGNSAVPWLYGPGLKTSNMSSNKKFMGLKSQGRKEGCSVEMLTASDLPAVALSLLPCNSTATSGQALSGEPTRVNRGHAGPHGQYHTAPEDPDGPDEAVNNRNKSEAWFPGAQPGDRGQDSLDPTVFSTQLSAFTGGVENFTNSVKLLHRAMIRLREQSVEDRVEIIRVNTELSESRQKSKVNDAKIAALEEEARIRKVADDDSEDLRGLLERRVAELEENLELSRQEVAYKADLLNRTSVATILQRAMTKNKGLGTTSLAELLYEMGGSDDMGNSGSKHSEDHQG